MYIHAGVLYIRYRRARLLRAEHDGQSALSAAALTGGSTELGDVVDVTTELCVERVVGVVVAGRGA